MRVFLAFIWGVVAAVIVLGAVLNVGPPQTHYFENVCKYNGGKVSENLCVKNDRVIGKSDNDSREYHPVP